MVSLLFTRMNIRDNNSRVVEHSALIDNRIRGASWKLPISSRHIELVWAQIVTRLATLADMLRGSMKSSVRSHNQATETLK